MTLRENFFHLENITISIAFTNRLCDMTSTSSSVRPVVSGNMKNTCIKATALNVAKIKYCVYINQFSIIPKGSESCSLSYMICSKAQEGPHMLGGATSKDTTTSNSTDLPRTQLNVQFVAVESETAFARIRRGKISAGYVHDTSSSRPINPTSATLHIRISRTGSHRNRK